MRTSQILLVALALMVLSSDHIPAAKASAAVTGTDCKTFILNPTEPCDPAKCQKDCDNTIKGGVGTCYVRRLPHGCGCQKCPAPSSSASILPRKLYRMN